MRVLITGAGPTGLTTGVALARNGIASKIVEKRDGYSTYSRAVGISPRSLRLLKPSGVTRELLEQGIITRAVNIFTGNQRICRLDIDLSDEHDNTVLMLAQDKTEAVLRQVYRHRGGEVIYGLTLTGLSQSDETIRAEFSDGTFEEFDYAIGADGVRSSTRRLLDVEFPGYDVPGTWSIADIDVPDWPHMDSFSISLLPKGGVVVFAPLEAKRLRLVSNTPDAIDVLPFPLTIENVRRRGKFKLWIRQVAQYRHGRVFLAGDAAHCHSPVGGRGMNLGIADGICLAECLSNGRLNDYHDLRHADGRKTIKASEVVRKIISSSNPVTRGILVTMIRMVKHSGFLQRKLVNGLLQD